MPFLPGARQDPAAPDLGHLCPASAQAADRDQAGAAAGVDSVRHRLGMPTCQTLPRLPTVGRSRRGSRSAMLAMLEILALLAFKRNKPDGSDSERAHRQSRPPRRRREGRGRLRAQLPAAAQAGAGGHRLEQAPDRSREEGRRGARGRGEDAQAEALAQRLEATEIEIARRVGENNTLYGSVTSADIAHALEAKGFQIDKRKITLVDPIKAIGDVTVPLKIHRDVTAQLKVKVVPDTH